MKFHEAERLVKEHLAPDLVPLEVLTEVLEGWQEERTALKDLLRRWLVDVGRPIEAALDNSDIFSDDVIENTKVDENLEHLRQDTEEVLEDEGI